MGHASVNINGQANAVQYLWDGWAVLAALDGEGRLLEYYTRGLGIAGDIGSIVAETRFANGAPVATYYYHNNHRGDVTAVREGTNTLTAVDYRTFGAIRSTTGPFTPRFGFSSKERDPASGLDYFGYRYYSAEFGRWVSEDPISFWAERVNLYRFCANNSINQPDLLGLSSPTDEITECYDRCLKMAEHVPSPGEFAKNCFAECDKDPEYVPCMGDLLTPPAQKPSLPKWPGIIKGIKGIGDYIYDACTPKKKCDDMDQ